MELRGRLQAALGNSYVLDTELARGGMARVYLADERHPRRRVVIKVLPPELATEISAERFEREIQLAASLQHSSIVPVLAAGAADGLPYYTMPYVEGQSLRVHLAARGRLGIDEIISILRDMARALAFAHEHGVIHRDIKPDNVLLSRGTALVTDFGIAKALSESRTHATGTLTQTGTSLGTPAYMAPEQVAGDPRIDARADLYAFGCVAYELLAGRTPFQGSPHEIVAAHLRDAPAPVLSIRGDTPETLAALVTQCLEKQPADRPQSASTILHVLEADVSSGKGRVDGTALRPHRGRRGMRRWPVVVGIGSTAAAVLVAIAVLNGFGSRPGRESNAVGSGSPTSIALPPEAPLSLGSDLPAIGYHSPVVALSPLGTWLAYVGKTPSGRMLFLHDMLRDSTWVLPGTEGALQGFFSPDGKEIGFITTDRVKKLSIQSGAVTTLCEARQTVEGWWRSPDYIHFTQNEVNLLSRVAAKGGGKAESVARRDSLFDGGFFSDVLPDGRLLVAGAGGRGDFGDILLVDPVTRSSTKVIQSGYAVRYIAPGYLLFVRAGQLVGIRFDIGLGATVGEPVTIAPALATESAMLKGHYAGAGTGLVAYVPGGDLSIGKPAWVDRQGRVEYLAEAEERVYGSVDLSPDDSRLAVHVPDIIDYILVFDFSRKERGRRVASGIPEGFPRWSVDGRRLATTSTNSESPLDFLPLRRPQQRSRIRDIDGIGRMTPPIELPPGQPGAGSRIWSPSGEFIQVRGLFASFSPDGRWVAYTRLANGRNEVFITSYPDTAVVRQVSNGGGIEPRWMASGELFFRWGQQWFSTQVSTVPELTVNQPAAAFNTDFIDTPMMSYDVSRDGKRLLVVKREKPIVTSRIELVPNWFSLLERH